VTSGSKAVNQADTTRSTDDAHAGREAAAGGSDAADMGGVGGKAVAKSSDPVKTSS
jgi:hypothetical protein